MVKIKEKLLDYLWVFPSVLFLIVVILLPFIRIINLSFHSYSFSKPESLNKFIGFTNYIELFKDPLFFNSLKATLIIIIPAVIIQLFCGFLIAIFFNNNFKFQRVILTIFIIPTMLAPIVVGLAWRFLLYTQNGLITNIFNFFGLFKDTSILSTQLNAIIAIILIDSWEWIPFVGLILLSGLIALPEEPFEAAIIDGASKIGLIRYVTLPLLKPIFIIAALFRFIDILKIFDIIYVITNGGPANATDVINLYMYRLNFIYFDLGYGSTPAVVLIIILIMLTLIIYLNSYLKRKIEKKRNKLL